LHSGPGDYNPPQMLNWKPPLFVCVVAILVVAPTGCALATKAPPRADAGPDIFASVGETVSFDGSQSADLDGGEIVFYQWTVTAAPEGQEAEVGRVLREGPDASVWTMESPLTNDDVGEWIIELLVTDDEGQSATDDLIMTVLP
jgi:hypothetical protein